MEKLNVDAKLELRELRFQFDQILGQHLERLIGTRYGISALPLEMATITCLFLLVDREKETEASQSSPPERYTEKTLIADVLGNGLDQSEDLTETLQNLIQLGYAEKSQEGVLSAKKPAISMAELLERVFPEIPGMHLVAYCVQTMEEVLSGRKELEAGLSQFGQTLQMQGIPIAAATSQSASEQSAKRHRQGQVRQAMARGKAPREKTLQKQRPSGFEVQHLLSSRRPAVPSRSGSGPKILGSRGQVLVYEFSDSIQKAEDSPTILSATHAEAEPREAETPRGDLGAEKHETEHVASSEAKGTPVDWHSFEEADVEAAEEERFTEQGSTELTAYRESSPTDAPAEEYTHEPPPLVSNEFEAGSESEEADIDDDFISRRIEAFEDDLALVCPACGIGKIRSEQTKRGKNYYVCANPTCNFVSWGKPYHMHCPKCQNPFVIEVNEDMLGCPRATCRHRLKVPAQRLEAPAGASSRTKEGQGQPDAVLAKTPRKRRVRRRVVRRKK